MDWETAFGAASALAMAGWAALLLLPRHPWVLGAVRYGLVSLLCVAYAALVMGYSFSVPGGGFGSIAEVRLLFSSDPVLLAGWIHYLAFDLMVGIEVARHADARGISRAVQAPVLLATFMFGPVGLLFSHAATAFHYLGMKGRPA